MLELADETEEYASRVLAGLGADVVKVEPPEGEATRRIGLFAGMCRRRRRACISGITISASAAVVNLDKPDGQEAFLQLASAAEAVLSLRERGLFDHHGPNRFRTLVSLKLNSRAGCGTVGGQQVVISAR